MKPYRAVVHLLVKSCYYLDWYTALELCIWVWITGAGGADFRTMIGRGNCKDEC